MAIIDERHCAIAVPLDLIDPLRIVERLFHQRRQHGMNFPRHGGSTDAWCLRQQLVQIFRDDSLRLRSAYAALRLFFFTLVFFLAVLDELRGGPILSAFFAERVGFLVTPDLITLPADFCFWVFRSSDFELARSPDPCSHSAPFRTAPLL